MIKGLEADIERTRAVQAVTEEVDPMCCNACAVHAYAVRTNAYPGGFVEDLIAAGVDPLRPREVWGAPDEGFLNGWFLAVGNATGDNIWADHAEKVFEKVADGFEIWMGKRITMRPPDLQVDDLVEIEFVWESDTLKELERKAWPPTASTRGV